MWIYPAGRREPLKVIGWGSDRAGEALYGDDIGGVCTGLETGDRQEEARCLCFYILSIKHLDICLHRTR